MKLRVQVLAWPLSLSVALAGAEKIAAEARIKDELIDRDEEKYKDVVVHLGLQDQPFLEPSSFQDPQKRKNLRDISGSSINEDEPKSDATASDEGKLKLYQVGGPPTGLSEGSVVSHESEHVEKIYMIVDRESAVGRTDGSGKREEPHSPVSMEGKIHVDDPSKASSDGMGNGSTANDHKEKEVMPLDPSMMAGRISRHRRASSGQRKFSRQRRQLQNAGEVTGNFHRDNKVLLNGCVRGTSSFVTNKCRFFNCCDGEDACQWPEDQIATVCPDSCNGYKACYYIGAGTYVGKESCNGSFIDGYSCAFFASTSTKAASKIGRDSCNGDKACSYICYSSNDCKAIIGRDACNGFRDCAFIGEPFETQNFQVESVFVGDGACVSTRGTRACNYVGSNARFVRIGDDSCLGESACNSVGYYAPLRVLVGEESCRGDRACNALGNTAGSENSNVKSKVIVGDGSCTAFESCRRLGLDTYYNVQVDDNSCTGYRSCLRFAEEVTGSYVRIRDNQCTQFAQCAGNPYNGDCENTAVVPNNGGRCPSTMA